MLLNVVVSDRNCDYETAEKYEDGYIVLCARNSCNSSNRQTLTSKESIIIALYIQYL